MFQTFSQILRGCLGLSFENRLCVLNNQNQIISCIKTCCRKIVFGFDYVV
ncbi:hypothetical protein HanIR_Chr11g0505071 [Helianthus annuus]|nr:hypothetical protein HanIR_Chr11g0505071 [Helianthus annuus]